MLQLGTLTHNAMPLCIYLVFEPSPHFHDYVFPFTLSLYLVSGIYCTNTPSHIISDISKFHLRLREFHPRSRSNIESRASLIPCSFSGIGSIISYEHYLIFVLCKLTRYMTSTTPCSTNKKFIKEFITNSMYLPPIFTSVDQTYLITNNKIFCFSIKDQHGFNQDFLSFTLTIKMHTHFGEKKKRWPKVFIVVFDENYIGSAFFLIFQLESLRVSVEI